MYYALNSNEKSLSLSHANFVDIHNKEIVHLIRIKYIFEQLQENFEQIDFFFTCLKS